MGDKKRFTVVGVFETRVRADQAVEELLRAGFAPEQIGVAARAESGPQAPGASATETRSGEVAAAGAAAGGTLGAVAGAVATGLIPGIGPALAAGLLTGILGGTALGAAAGGLIGALIGLGVPEVDARYYDRQLSAGRIIMAVEATERSAEAARILRAAGAYPVTSAR